MERAGLGLCDACGGLLGIQGIASIGGFLACSTECHKKLLAAQLVMGAIKDRNKKQTEESPLKTQCGGNHYKEYEIQPIEYIVANKLNFIEGCIVKYVSRHRNKNGAEDIKKIIHYCELLLELEYKEEV